MRCTNCGAELYEGTSFCTSCGTPVSAPAAYDMGNDYGYFTDPYSVPPVTPVKKKAKRPLGLMIAGGIAALLVIVVVIGLCTNWFGFYGPATRIALAADNTIKKGNFTIEMTYNVEDGDKTESTLQVDIDLKKRELTLLIESEGTDYWTDLNYTRYMAIYDGYAITGNVYEDGSEYYSKQDISDELEEVFDAYEDAKDMKWDELLDTIEEKTDIDISDYIDTKALKKCANQYFRKLNSNKWLKENAGYTKTKKNGVTYFEFEPNNYRFIKASLECFETAIEDEDDYENMMDVLKESKSSLNAVDLEMSFGIKGNKLVEVECKVETKYSCTEMSFEFSNIGKTSIDEGLLEDMLDKAE